MLKALKGARQEVGLSQKELAGMLDIAPEYLCSIENNKRHSKKVEEMAWEIINNLKAKLNGTGETGNCDPTNNTTIGGLHE